MPQDLLKGPIRPPTPAPYEVKISDVDIPFWSIFRVCLKATICIGFFAVLAWIAVALMAISSR